MSFRCQKCGNAITKIEKAVAKPTKVVTRINRVKDELQISKEEEWCDECVASNPNFEPEIRNLNEFR